MTGGHCRGHRRISARRMTEVVAARRGGADSTAIGDLLFGEFAGVSGGKVPIRNRSGTARAYESMDQEHARLLDFFGVGVAGVSSIPRRK